MGTSVTRAAQNLLLIMIGAAVLWVTVATDEYVNYVKPGFRPVLILAALAVVALGAAGLRREWRDDGRGESSATGCALPPPAALPAPVLGAVVAEPTATGASGGPGTRPAVGDHAAEHTGHGHGHGHGHAHGHAHRHGPRVAWLLCLPAVTIFAIAPPPLGSFTAGRGQARAAVPVSAPAEGFGPLRQTTDGVPIDMTISEYIGRSFEAQMGDPSSLRGRSIRLTGFVLPRKGGGWQVTRLNISCCAGDAIPLMVIVQGKRRPPTDSWVQVTGTWLPPGPEGARTGVHELAATQVTPVRKPKRPYE